MTQKSQSDKQRHAKKKPLLLWMTALLFSCLCWTPAWGNGLDEQQLVEKAKHTVESFMGDPNFTWFRDHVKNANALLIIPQQLKAAFWFGVDGGSGVLVTRDEQTGAWSEPAFYDLGGLSFGFQFGGEASEVIILAMTQGAVEKLYASSFKLGGDASIAAGPYGAGAEGATSANLDADFLSFSRSKGVYAGISLEGSIIYVNDDANEAYYGKKVRPVDILVIKSVKNKHSAGLRQAIMTATK
jgi:lipid-binding SYLF domain-containing protein